MVPGLAGDSEAIHVATGDGELAVLDVQPEGRRAMRAHDFLLGHRLATGETFSES